MDTSEANNHGNHRGSEANPRTLKEVGLSRRVRAAGGSNLKEAGDFFGWKPSRVTKVVGDFTKEQLLARGWTKELLLDVAEGYEQLARITPDNPSAAGRAAQLREIAELFDVWGGVIMAGRSRFIIHNDLGRPMVLNIEPEGTFFPLDEGNEVSVTDMYEIVPVTLKISCEDGGDPVLSIWPGDGDIKVEKDGIDVLEINGPIHGSLGFQA